MLIIYITNLRKHEKIWKVTFAHKTPGYVTSCIYINGILPAPLFAINLVLKNFTFF